jgi:hypothetical protein
LLGQTPQDLQKGEGTMNYKNYTIEKFARRGIYQVTDNAGNLIIIVPLLKQAKKFIDQKVGN